MDTSAKSATSASEPATRRIRTLEEKLRILAEAAKPGASVAVVARRHDLNANLLFAWRRMQRRGLLESQRHAPAAHPLLPVKITEPTITPTRRASAMTPAAPTSSPSPMSCIELVIDERTRLRLHGEAQKVVLARVLEWLPRR